MFHCVNFRHSKILFLFDNPLFRHRIVKIGYCPKCKRTVISLVEERKIDGMQFRQVKSGVEATNYLSKIVTNIDYTSDTTSKVKNLPCGWVYGTNTCSKNGKIKQFATDFSGKKKLIKTIEFKGMKNGKKTAVQET